MKCYVYDGHDQLRILHANGDAQQIIDSIRHITWWCTRWCCKYAYLMCNIYVHIAKPQTWLYSSRYASVKFFAKKYWSFLLQADLLDACVVTPMDVTDSGNQHVNSEVVTVEVHAPQDPLISAHMTHKSTDSQIRVWHYYAQCLFGIFCTIKYLTDMYTMFVFNIPFYL